VPFLHPKCAFFALLVCLFGFEVLIGEGGVGYRYFIVFYQHPKIKKNKAKRKNNKAKKYFFKIKV
jgi:hypothetical protein